MAQPEQLKLFDTDHSADTPPAPQSGDDAYFAGRELGTFKDSMRAPIHRWFRYPAGYSYKFVFESFDLFNVSTDDWVYDPFSGTGTTLVCAKQRGINAYGVEAHSFVHWVAAVKLYWEYDFLHLERQVDELLTQIRKYVRRNVVAIDTEGVFPELVYKCYHPDDLKVLFLLREFIIHEIRDLHIQELFKLGLTDTLRGAAVAGTGWPYISPRKNPTETTPKGALQVFENTLRQMCADLETVARSESGCEILNILGDSRQKQTLTDGQVKLALTSPPYLNNYDYADRTRLETYFWDIARSWKEITEQFRDKLIVAATTQIVRGQHDVETTLSREIRELAPSVYREVQEAILALADTRQTKGGKKDYDLMVGLYFNDMLQVLRETERVLQPDGHFCLVLGDSAPYGVHLQTERLIGQLGLGIGFSRFEYHELRCRGKKWRDNPQRHRVPLREGIVVLTK